MKIEKLKNIIRCAIYTRKSTEEGLEQDFNSLDAQREACEAYIKSQQHEGWVLVEKQYNDGSTQRGVNLTTSAYGAANTAQDWRDRIRAIVRGR